MSTSISLQITDNETIEASNGTLSVIDGVFVTQDEVGAAGGVASLDSDGLVPSSQLPSYVDDVLEYDSRDDFPEEGEADKIYVATDDNTIWRWSGSTYIQIDSSVGSADVAAKLGTSTVGGTAQGIYLDEGSPKAMSATVGSTSAPVYLDAGEIKACTEVDANPFAGEDAGSDVNPVYLKDGAITASAGTVGSTTAPVYLSSGTITACTGVATADDVEAAVDNLTLTGSLSDSGVLTITLG